MANRLCRIIDKLGMCGGALLFSQLPLFIQYYTQQLVGRVYELQWQVEAIRQVAIQSGKGLDQYIQKFILSTDPDFVLQGQLMQQMMSRWHYYSEGLLALEHASLWMQPLIFLRYFDWSVARSTYDNYTAGLTLNSEGLVFGGLGMIAGYLLALSLRGLAYIIYINLKQYLYSPQKKKSEIPY
jgi:hypothetical protein